MELRLYDTYTREKRPFAPLDPARVRMYVCGPTVYDFAHIGNARPVIVFDVLFRLLRHLYGADHVTYVRNITDVDDKINARAAEEYPGLPLNEAIRRVTQKTEKQFHEDVDALGCLRPTVEPRATEHIAEMRALIERLLASDHAYVEQEHVLFRVATMLDYGKLARRSLDEMIAGARVEIAPYKRDPMDFVLWKPSKPGEPAWESPAGIRTPGRPGWHIECSAMSDRWLWTEAKPSLSRAGLAHPHQFDIHGGGVDLVFPHHENEIAQSRCAFHTPVMANYWMHNGFLQVEGRKMAKSEGNFITIRELLTRYPGDVLRLLMLTKNYRQPIDWTSDGVNSARNELLNWSELVFDFARMHQDFGAVEGQVDSELVDALLDDLNTPIALARMREMYQLVRQRRMAVEDFVATLRFMGFRNLNKSGFFHPGFEARVFSSGPQITKKEVAEIITFRAATANNFVQVATSLKNSLASSGFRVSLDDAGVLRVGNVTSAEMEKLERDKLKRDSEQKSGEPGETTLTIRPADFRDAENVPVAGINHDEVQRLVDLRNVARKARSFEESDRIRNYLLEQGVELEDHKDGTTTWKAKR